LAVEAVVVGFPTQRRLGHQLVVQAEQVIYIQVERVVYQQPLIQMEGLVEVVQVILVMVPMLQVIMEVMVETVVEAAEELIILEHQALAVMA
jgi:hypothetical protein